MNEIWRKIPRELLSNIFKYLPPEYIKIELIRWVSKKDLMTMVRKTTFFSSVNNYTVCMLLKHTEISWYSITHYYKKLSESFMREFHDKIDWKVISSCHTLSEPFIREFQHKVDWVFISCCQTLSEPFIREFQHKVDWGFISCWQTLSESFIREFKNNVDFMYISCYQTLSESFIREFKNNLDFRCISIYQKTLSEPFMRDFQ